MGQSGPGMGDERLRLMAVREILPLTAAPMPELQAISDLAKTMFDVSRAAIHIIDEDWMHIIEQSGETVAECARDISACNIVVTRNEPLVIPDLAKDPQWRAMPYVTARPHIRFYAGAPIEMGPGMTVGSFCLTDSQPRSLTETELSSLRHFADVAGALFRLQRSNFTMRVAEQALKDAAMTDPLTGFYNRTALDLIIDGELAEALGGRGSFGALAIDMDGFKAINDTFGHGAGDRVLEEAALRIRKAIRADDIVVRMGGDEFVVFVPSPSQPNLLGEIAEALLVAFREPFVVDGRQIVANLSIGGAMAPDAGGDRASLLKSVDDALYQAKRAGRNRFIACAL